MKEKLDVIHIYADYATHAVAVELFFRELDTTHCIHSYVLLGDPENRETYKDIDDGNVTFTTDFDQIITALQSFDDDVIFVFHSLFSYEQWVALFLSRLYQRAIWVIWGAEIYKHILPPPAGTPFKNHVKRTIELWLKRLLAKKFLGIVALTRGDARLVTSKLWGSVDNPVLRYPLPGLNACRGDKPVPPPEPHQTIRVICGNSADPSNQHIEMLNMLSQYANENIELHMPLNYGADAEYIQDVCKHGQEIFGDKFVPITEFMAREKYDSLLASMDVGFYMHSRQQGLYVVYSLLLQGKPFYLNPNASTFEDCIDLGISVRDATTTTQLPFEEFGREDPQTAQNNVNIARRSFTKEPLKEVWQDYLAKFQTAQAQHNSSTS